MDTGGEKVVYQIIIGGTLDPSWSVWLNGMEIRTENEEEPITTLCGVVSDQPMLRGILCKLWDLNFKVISISQVKVADGALKQEESPNE